MLRHSDYMAAAEAAGGDDVKVLAVIRSADVLPATTPGEPTSEETFLAWPTVAVEGVEIRAMSSVLGSALVRLTDEEIVVNCRRLRTIYEASATDEKKQRDKGASGRVKTNFEVKMSDYESGRYGDE
jgi:hypothetical protein